MAYLICQDSEQASDALVEAIADATDAAPLLIGGKRMTHDLARLTLLACAEIVPTVYQPVQNAPVDDPPSLQEWMSCLEPHRRALLALVMYGDHTYDEAAALLRVESDSAAWALRVTLRSFPSTACPPARQAGPESLLVQRALERPSGTVLSGGRDGA